jgi:RNA polymerase sigma factor (sigma-70 family)
LQSDDKILWHSFKNGSERAFTNIFENHYHSLYAYGHCFTSQDEHIKDCIQEVFSELWQNRKKVANVTRIRPYLMVYLKRKILSQKISLLNMAKDPIDVEVPYENLLIDKETTSTIKVLISNSIANLTDRQREVVYLKFYAGLDYKDISEVTSIKYQSVRNLMHEAMKVLKKNIKYFFQ